MGRWRDIQVGTFLTVLLLLLSVYLFKYFTYYRKRNTQLSRQMKIRLMIAHLATALVAGFYMAENKGFDSFPFLEDSFYEEPAAVILWFNIFLLPLGLLIDMIFKSPKLSDEPDEDEDDDDF
jgi:TRAP-type C4-dicarboxylate transport system permease large subunit